MTLCIDHVYVTLLPPEFRSVSWVWRTQPSPHTNQAQVPYGPPGWRRAAGCYGWVGVGWVKNRSEFWLS